MTNVYVGRVKAKREGAVARENEGLQLEVTGRIEGRDGVRYITICS